MTDKQQKAVLGLFLLLVFGCTAASLFLPKREFSEKENRVLAQLPKPEIADVLDGTFSKEYETYLADQFFGRDGWIGVKTMAERLEGKSEINDIFFADDGYLIEKHSGVFETDTAQRNIGFLADFLAYWSGRIGSSHVKAMIVPNAVEILKEKLPPFAECPEEAEYLEKIRNALPADTFEDVTGLLWEHREEELYYRTDHHWKTYAARLAYEQWAQDCGIDILPVSGYRIETLSEDFHGTIDAKVNIRMPGDSIEYYGPVNEIPYRVRINHKEEKDTILEESCLEGRDKYAVFFGGNQPLIEITSEAASDRRLLVIKDSYANCFLPFAIQDFAGTDIIDLRYFNEDLKEFIDNGAYTDILLLYNASGFAEDPAAARLALGMEK